MAATKEIVEYLIKDVTCQICNDVFTDARDLSCGHAFCLSCLQYKENKRCLLCVEVKEQVEEVKSRKCPICGEESIPDGEDINKLKVNKEKTTLAGLEIAKRSKLAFVF